MELQNVQAALRPAERVVSSVRAARPWLIVLAPLAGLVAARSWRNQGSGFSKLVGLLKYVRPMLGLWNQFKSGFAEGTSESSAAPPISGRKLD